MTDDGRTDGGRNGDSPHHPLQLSYTIGDDESPSMAVVRATAILTDTSPLDLEPLYDVVDPDHLNGMFQSPDGRDVLVETSFIYNGCRVRVTPNEVHLERVRDEP